VTLHQPQRQVDSGRDPAGGDDVAVVHDSGVDHFGTRRGQILQGAEVGHRRPPTQQASGRQQHRASAPRRQWHAGGGQIRQRGGQRAALRLNPCATASGYLSAGSCTTASVWRVPAAAGHDHQIPAAVAEQATRAHGQSMGGDDLGGRFQRHQRHRQVGTRGRRGAQHLVRPDRVELVEARVQDDCDAHGCEASDVDARVALQFRARHLAIPSPASTNSAPRSRLAPRHQSSRQRAGIGHG